MHSLPDYRKAWKHVRPGLDKIKARFDPPWMVEDVFGELASGAWTLVQFGRETEFAIVRFEAEEFTGLRELVVWIAYSEEGDALERCTPDVMEIAKEGGASRVRIQTPRTGYERLGWTEHARIFTKDVEDAECKSTEADRK